MPGAGPSLSYFSQVFALSRLSVVQLVRPPSAPRRAEAARRDLKRALLLMAIGAAAIVVLMVTFDAIEIGMMPPRGTPGLWPVRILTDFGKDAYVLWLLAAALVAIGLVVPLRRGLSRIRLSHFGTHVQYLFFAVLVPVLTGEVIKWVVGRGRPFVAVTSFALAFAVAAIWPKMRIAMAVYALSIAASRLVLLAHHPSDVVAGGLLGVIGAMAVRYWFAARRLGFAIQDHGEIAPR